MARNKNNDMKILLDLDIVKSLHGQEILPYLLKSGYAYEVTSQKIRNSITVLRLFSIPIINDLGETVMSKEEPFCILVWDTDTLMPLIKQKQLMTTMKDLSKSIPGFKIMLALCGVSDYFRAAKKKLESKRPQNVHLERPVNRREFEWCLTELQLIMNIDHRVLNTADEFCLFIKQYVKSIAEIPYKLERHEKDLLTDGCAIGNRSESVVINKAHEGLGRLFKQQLMQFPRCTLDMADAIVSKYPTVKHLIEAYKECSCDQGMLLLSELQVRRAAGPLAKTRNVGPEISKKLYRFYTAMDGKVDIDG